MIHRDDTQQTIQRRYTEMIHSRRYRETEMIHRRRYREDTQR